VIHANPLAQRLNDVYKPIARTSVNPLAGIVIDLLYGFFMAGVFLLLYKSLPGQTGLVKGVSFAFLERFPRISPTTVFVVGDKSLRTACGVIVGNAMAWFFRVVMCTASQWVMFNVPVQTLLYSLVTGLDEMLILGVLYGLTLKPTR
jgi:hypothetical protein